jgi:hypothetical protein
VAEASGGFVQQVSAHQSSGSGSSIAVAPLSSVATGNRLIVLVGVWANGGATASSVSDSAGNSYTEILSRVASDSTELSVWTAPITGGGGTKPTVTATASGAADLGIAVLEYSGLSTVADATAVDQKAVQAGTTSGAGTVSSGATPATTAASELAVGFYVDSGFGDTLSAGGGWASRVNNAPQSDMELLAEDQTVAQGATPNASAGTGSGTTWLMATVVFKLGSGATAPGTPTGVTATAGSALATVSWTAPSSDGGSAITGYTVTSSPGGQTATVGGSTTSATVTGLTNGTAYTFTVTATNAIGTGPASSPSNSVTPATVPGAPTGVTASAGNAQAAVSWTAPASNGGSAITGYTVTSSPGGQTAPAGAPPRPR